MKLLVLAALVATAAASGCPNKCSGHGSCILGDRCDCQPRFVGNDCSERECPYGLSWVTSSDTDRAPAGTMSTCKRSAAATALFGTAECGNLATTAAECTNARGCSLDLNAAGALACTDICATATKKDACGTGNRAACEWAAGEGLGGRHDYAECSSKGKCDRSTGECQCFEGYEGRGCRRQACPNDCSGHGACVANDDVNPNYQASSGGALGTQYWDASRAFSCRCDAGYQGIDCSARMCPRGDDPMVDCPGPNVPQQQDDIQMLIFDQPDTHTFLGSDVTSIAIASSGAHVLGVDGDGSTKVGVNGYFSLTFTDMFGANYTTMPIYLGKEADDYSSSIESALEALPNFVVPNVTVSKHRYAGGGVHGHRYAVTFVDDINAGKQNKLQCSWAGAHESSSAGDFAGAAPRLGDSVINAPNGVGTNSVNNELRRACTVLHMFNFDHDSYDGSPTQMQALCERYAGASVAEDGIGDTNYAVAGDNDAISSGFPQGYASGTVQWMTNTNAFLTETYDDSARGCSLVGLQKQGSSNRNNLNNGNVHEEHTECSNRGSCDTSTGLCECYEGFSGEACASQSIYV